MRLIIDIDLANAAFFDDDGKQRAAPEVKRILHDLALRFYDDESSDEQSEHEQTLLDQNGNPVGRVAITAGSADHV